MQRLPRSHRQSAICGLPSRSQSMYGVVHKIRRYRAALPGSSTGEAMSRLSLANQYPGTPIKTDKTKGAVAPFGASKRSFSLPRPASWELGRGG